MKLHLVRHGTTSSGGRTYAGRSDVPLSEDGIRMSRQLVDGLGKAPIGAILSSPLRRAMDTAAPLARFRGLEVQTNPLLLEIDFGKLEGKPKADLGLVLRKTHARAPIPGGEALIDVWNRAERFLADLTEHHDADAAEVVIVGHFWINRMLYGLINAMDFETTCRSRSYRPETGSVATLEWQSR